MTHNSEDRLWRTLVVVTRVRDDHYVLRIPGWEPRKRVKIKKDDLPQVVRDLCDDGSPTPGYPERYLHARVNIGVSRKEDLRFESWELS